MLVSRFPGPFVAIICAQCLMPVKKKVFVRFNRPNPTSQIRMADSYSLLIYEMVNYRLIRHLPGKCFCGCDLLTEVAFDR